MTWAYITKINNEFKHGDERLFCNYKKGSKSGQSYNLGEKISYHNVIIPGLPQIIESEEKRGLFLDETWAPKPVAVIRVNSR